MTFQHTSTIDTNVNGNSEKPAPESCKASGEAEAIIAATATYSPDDNKLRLYPVGRLDSATYERVKEAGFIWAPKQGLFVAPAWSPEREDLLVELCGEIGDEDVSLMERQEERAERFAGYSAKRKDEASEARADVAKIADGIPFGQPILIGHHSQARAERDARRIRDGMRKALTLWHTSEYWQRRAAGALRLAKYKERPDVRARRIKRIEADKRKAERILADSSKLVKVWGRPDLTTEQATKIAGFYDSPAIPVDGGQFESLYSLLTYRGWTAQQASQAAIAQHEGRIARAQRWIAHYDHRLTYEKAMLGQVGGLAAERFDIAPGGMVLIGNEWLTVVRVTKRDGRAVSVTTNGRCGRRRGIEEVKDYRAPEAGAAEAVKAATALGPIVNVRAEDCVEMTAAEFKALGEWSRQIRKVPASEAAGVHRVRQVMRGGCLLPVFLTDAKQVAIPAPQGAPAPALKRERIIPEPAVNAGQGVPEQAPGAEFAAMAEQLRAGVEVVVVPDLFPTPATVAARMVEVAQVNAGDVVLEPSAGTGALITAVKDTGLPLQINAIERSAGLAEQLANAHEDVRVMGADFFDVKPGHIEQADVILMNPPFRNAIDIDHIMHARGFLKPGGRLVAICAAGPRQVEKLRPLVEASGGVWEPLPEGTFKEQGTNVRTVLLSIRS